MVIVGLSARILWIDNILVYFVFEVACIKSFLLFTVFPHHFISTIA